MINKKHFSIFILGIFFAFSAFIYITPKAQAASIPATSDEFVGPFSSWANIKTAYGAAGDGTTDDTAAIQSALNQIGTTGHSPVLYFPSGTYKITSTLSLGHTAGVRILGEDPSITTLSWSGAASGTILSINGVASSEFSRLTFDGNASALMDVDQTWDSNSQFFDTANLYQDDWFINAGYGIRGGFAGGGFAETTIQRSHFVNDTIVGVGMGNFNALDTWIWYSTFQNCNVGVGNYVPGVFAGAGNFNVYNSIFSSSTTADLYIGNTGEFTVRDNFSSGSKYFFENGGTNNPAEADIIGNTILDPTNSNQTAILMGDQGPGLLMDNTIRTQASSTGPVIFWQPFSNDADVESFNNTFTNNNTIFYGTGSSKLITPGDQVADPSTVNPSPPTLPGVLPNLSRQFFEVPNGASASDIQTIINQAFAQNGNRPVVHFPYGFYNINTTITVPASDIQLIGDSSANGGIGSSLLWSGTGVGPLLLLNGPSKVTVRDMEINTQGTADGILAKNLDQSSSRVYLDRSNQGYINTKNGLLINGLDNTEVQLRSNNSYSGVKVIGGPLSAEGQSTTAKVNIYGSAGGNSGNGPAFELKNGANLLIHTFFNDTGNGPPTNSFAKITGRAQLNVSGGIVAQPGGSTPAFDIQGQIGTTTIVSGQIQNPVFNISGDGTNTKLLGLGLLLEHYDVPLINNAIPSGLALMLNMRTPTSTDSNSSNDQIADVGTATPEAILSMLGQNEVQQPQVLSSLPEGASDVRFFSLNISGLNGITLQGDINPVDVSITSPLNSSTASSTTTLAATATDSNDVPISSLQFQIDGANLGPALTTTSSPDTYSKVWDTGSALNGSHVITAIATDVLGNTATTTSTVNINNELAITSFFASPPSIRAHASSTLAWTTAGATTVSINQGLGDQGGAISSGTVSVSPLLPTIYTLTASDGIATVTTTTSVSIDNTPPSTPTGLGATASSTTEIDLSWNASTDDVGVTGYNIYRDGVSIATSSNPFYADTGLIYGTEYIYAIDAFDAADNISSLSNPLSFISGGGIHYNAAGEVGQTDALGNQVFNTANCNNDPSGDCNFMYPYAGFWFSYESGLDAKNHRLFVADNDGNRILVFQLDDSNNIATTVPSYVIGQPDFLTNNISSAPDGINYPGGVTYDPDSDRLFLMDYYNSRVLIYDVSPGYIHNGESAENVLGQPLLSGDITGGSGTTTRSGLSLPWDAVYDPQTRRLFVDDYGNSRVMVFDAATSTITDGEDALNVLGQPDFVSSTPTTTRSGLSNFWSGLAYDSLTQRLFVGDTYNNRVLVFDTATSTIHDSEDALNVIGQSDFVSNGSGVTQSSFDENGGVAYDPVTQTLFVSDYGNARVLSFDSATSTIMDGEGAENVLGQPDFTSNNFGLSQSGFSDPWNLAFDPINRQLFVDDSYNYKVDQFSLIQITTNSLPDAVTGAGYTGTIAARHSQGSVNFVVRSGSFPPGLSLNGSSGLISGTPTYPGTYDFTIQANDNTGPGSFTDRRDLTITVTGNPVQNSGGGGSAYQPAIIIPQIQNPIHPPPSPNNNIQTPPKFTHLINDHGTFYLVSNGQRRAITNPGILNSYGFVFRDSKVPSPADLVLPIGSNLAPNDGALVKTPTNPTVYLISAGKKYGFVSTKVFAGLGFKFSSVLIVTAPELNLMPLGEIISDAKSRHLPGLNINLQKTIYYIGIDNQLHGYPSLNIYNSWNIANDFSRAVPANAADLTLPFGDSITRRLY